VKQEHKRKGQWAYDAVTRRIIELLEKGVVPWRQPWRVELARNLVTGRPYRGINALLLTCAVFRSPYWVTLRQANHLGGHIKRNERGSTVVFWKLLEHDTEIDEGQTQTRMVPLARCYTIFNVEQCEGLDEHIPTSTEKQFKPVERAEAVIATIPRPPEIRHGARRACYGPAEDVVHMPAPEAFAPAEEYYSTLLHELAHATGHKSRLARPSVVDVQAFGSHAYSKEELVAEIGAAFLCAHCGIDNATLENSAAYINAWLERLKVDPRLIVHSAAQAQKAADYILAHNEENEAVAAGAEARGGRAATRKQEGGR
jgi:antirestriction protein ArdC